MITPVAVPMGLSALQILHGVLFLHSLRHRILRQVGQSDRSWLANAVGSVNSEAFQVACRLLLIQSARVTQLFVNFFS